jgi:hypothetical protein
MSDNLKYIDVDSEEFEDTPRALREHVKKLQKALTDERSAHGQTRNRLASRAVSDVLADKGFKNPKRVERDLLADDIDPLDTEAVERWLAENSDDYAKGEAASAAATETEPASVPAEQQQALQSMNVSDVPPAGGASKWDLVMSEITPDMDGKAVQAVYAKHGI